MGGRPDETLPKGRVGLPPARHGSVGGEGVGDGAGFRAPSPTCGACAVHLMHPKRHALLSDVDSFVAAPGLSATAECTAATCTHEHYHEGSLDEDEGAVELSGTCLPALYHPSACH